MPSSKVYLTYKRKLTSSRTGPTHSNECDHSPESDHSPSEGPSFTSVTTPDKHDGCSDGYKPETKQRSSSIFPGCVVCGVRGNLLQCNDCHQPYHYQCLDQPLKCGCKQQDPLQTSQSSNDEEAKKHSEGANMELSLESKPSLVGISPCSVLRKVDNEKLVSQTMKIDSENRLNLINSKSSTKRNCSLPCEIGPSNVESTVALSKDKSINITANLHEQSNLVIPLITFSRRCKRKRCDDEIDIRSSPCNEEKDCLLLTKWSRSIDGAPSHKGCLENHSTDAKLPEEDSKARHVGSKDQENVNDSVSAQAQLGSSVETKSMAREGQLHGCSSIFKDGSPMVLDKSLNDAALPGGLPTSCLQNSLSNDVKDSSEAVIADRESEDIQTQEESIMGATVPPHAAEGMSSCFDLSAEPPDSGGSLDLDLDFKRKSDDHASETVCNSMELTRRDPATNLHEVFPSPVCSRNERADKIVDTSSIEEVVASSKGDGFAADSAAGKKCLQLFSEEKGGIVMPKGADCVVAVEKGSYQLGSENNHIRQPSSRSPLDLCLSLATEPIISHHPPNKFSSSSKLWYSGHEIREFIQDPVPQSSSNQAASLLRHKAMLDSIASRAMALTARCAFQDNQKTYAISWSEPELDSLWIGVRRHGTDWDAILRNPRLYFLPCRTAKDLAERWEEEVAKVQEEEVPHFKYSTRHSWATDDTNGHFMGPRMGMWREYATDETRLSLGDVYARRGGSVSRRHHFKLSTLENNNIQQVDRPASYSRISPFSDFRGELYGRRSYDDLSSNLMPRYIPMPSNDSMATLPVEGNLPNWLRETVSSSFRSMEVTQQFPVFPTSSRPFPDFYRPNHGQQNGIHGEFSGIKESELHSCGSAQQSNGSVIRRGIITEGRRTALHHANKPEDVIIIDSDASSEETISDDHSTRPQL